jgi:hypothetical protein
MTVSRSQIIRRSTTVGRFTTGRRATNKVSSTAPVVCTNSMKVCRGLADVAEHLKGFQVRSPGGSFRTNNKIGWGTYALAEWQFVDAKGDAGFSGYDVLTFDEEGLISTILMFSNVEAQKLAWLMSGSGVLVRSFNERGDEGAKQGFAASARIVHELKEAEVERQLVLRDAPVRAQPRA